MRFVLLALLVLLCMFVIFPQPLMAQEFEPECGVTCEPAGSSETYLGGTVQARTLPRNARGLSTIFARSAAGAPPMAEEVPTPGSESYNYAIPILNFPGRNGLNVGLVLFYNSRVWTIDPTNGTATFNAERDYPSYGFRLGYGYIEEDLENGGYILVEPDGGKRALATQSGGKWLAADSSFIDYDASTKVMRRKDGTQWKYEQVDSTAIYRPIQIKDTNGNYISISYKSTTSNYGKFAIDTITDTLGRTISFAYDGSYKLTSITAPNITSGTRTVASFTWSTTSLTHNFTLDVEDTKTSGSTINVLTECKYANDTKYVFTYGHWGIVKKIEFKSATGNTRRYVEYNYPDTSTALSDHPTYTTQTVYDGVNTSSWTTAVTKTSGLVSAYSITAPNGTKTTTNLYTSGWQTGLVSSVVVQNGSTTLHTSTNTWAHNGNPILTAVTTTLNDTGQQSKVELSYTTYGNVSEIKEYDWGPNLFRKTQTDYETATDYVNNHILDRPKQVRIYDASSTLKSRTDLAYDGSSPANVTGADQHDSNYGTGFNIRGNLTSITRYPDLPSTGTTVTRNFTYDILGNLLTAQVNCCQQEEWTFGSATQYAYPTSIKRGPSGNQLTTNLTYDANTGLLLSETDPNSQQTSYTYNDSLLRLTAISAPLSAGSTFSYDDDSTQFKSTTTTSIDSTNSVVQVTTTDGAGRPTKRETKNSGGSTTYSIVETQYDSMGRVFKVSNPYAPSGSVVWTETQYDDLSRPVKVIPPDGSASSNNTQFAYLGNKTTVTDPAGKQRATLTDALGRVVQVHEPGFEDGRPGTGSVTIEGFLQSDSYEECTLWWEEECFSWEWITVYDSGGVDVTVGSTSKHIPYGQGSTAGAIAAALATAFNNDQNSPVTAMASGGVVSFIAKVGGPNTNYSLSASSYTDDPMRFGGPSFTATPSGSTLTGGSANPSPDTPLVTTSSYDVFDNLLLVVQGVQNRSYTYDSLGRLTRVVTPEGGQVDYTYNSFDLVVTRDDPRDVTTTYQYDGLNRVIGVGYSIGQGSTSTSMPNNCTPSGGSAAHVCFVYGSTAASYNNGRLIQMIDGVGGEEYTYDALGRVTKVDKEIDSTTYSIEYAYNRVGAITSVEYPSGRTVAHSFDAIGRLTQVASGGTNHVSNVTYNAAHAPTAYDYGNGVAASIGYNSRFQLASLAYAKSGTKLLELAYGYTGHSNGGNNGQITGITDSTGTQEAGRSVSYTYDAWARLKTATTNGSTTYPAWGLSWTYDRYGNRTEQIQTAGSPPAHDPAVDSETNQFTDSGYDYDDAGNMTADGLNRCSAGGPASTPVQWEMRGGGSKYRPEERQGAGLSSSTSFH